MIFKRHKVRTDEVAETAAYALALDKKYSEKKKFVSLICCSIAFTSEEEIINAFARAAMKAKENFLGRHIILSLAPGERKSLQEWKAIIESVLKKTGYHTASIYLAVLHRDTAIEHAHLVLLLSTIVGAPFKIRGEKKRLFEATRAIEKEFSLIELESSLSWGPVNEGRIKPKHSFKQVMRECIDKAIETTETLEDFLEQVKVVSRDIVQNFIRLLKKDNQQATLERIGPSAQEVTPRVRYDKAGDARGISFGLGDKGAVSSGTRLGSNYTLPSIIKRIKESVSSIFNLKRRNPASEPPKARQARQIESTINVTADHGQNRNSLLPNFRGSNGLINSASQPRDVEGKINSGDQTQHRLNLFKEEVLIRMHWIGILLEQLQLELRATLRADRDKGPVKPKPDILDANQSAAAPLAHETFVGKKESDQRFDKAGENQAINAKSAIQITAKKIYPFSKSTLMLLFPSGSASNFLPIKLSYSFLSPKLNKLLGSVALLRKWHKSTPTVALKNEETATTPLPSAVTKNSSEESSLKSNSLSSEELLKSSSTDIKTRRLGQESEAFRAEQRRRQNALLVSELETIHMELIYRLANDRIKKQDELTYYLDYFKISSNPKFNGTSLEELHKDRGELFESLKSAHDIKVSDFPLLERLIDRYNYEKIRQPMSTYYETKAQKRNPTGNNNQQGNSRKARVYIPPDRSNGQSLPGIGNLNGRGSKNNGNNVGL